MVRLLVLLLCISITTTQKPGSFSFKEKGFKSNHNYDVDPQVLEIQRQNLITQKILQRYLERRLHPERKPQIHVPSVDEILPKSPPPGSVRDVRQQNTTLSGNPLLRSTASGSRYSLFNDYNSKQYDSLDGDEESIQQQQRQQGLIGEDYDDSEGDLEQYEDLGGSLDNDHIDIESLQSGESEHVDSFYRDKYYRQRASQLSADYGSVLGLSALDNDFDDPEVSVMSEITNELRLLTEANKKSTGNSLADEIRPTKTREKRQAINSRTNRRRTAQREQTITNRIDSRYYYSDDYIDYTTTPRMAKNLRDNYADYRQQSKSKSSINEIKPSRPRTVGIQSTLTRNTARSRNRANTLKSLAYKPNYNANTRRPTFTLSAYGGNNKAPSRGNTRRGGNSRTYKDEDYRGNRFGHTTSSDWRKKSVSLGSTSLQPSTPALTVTFYLPTDTTVSLVTNSKTEISLIKTTTTSIEEICTSCFSLTQGPNGLPVHVLNKEITSFNRDGQFEITKFILSSTPTTTVSISQNTFRGRQTAYSATISTTIYEASPFIQTKGNNNPNSAILSNAPLANILLSQLLLGNLGGVGEPNLAPRPTEFIPDPNRYQLVVTTATEYKTHVKEIVTTVTATKSIVLPITFQGREILTTVYDTDVTPTVLTSFITETLTIPTTSTIRIQPTTDDLSNKLSLLLPLLEERERRNQLLSAAAEPVLPIISTPPPTSILPSSASISKVYVSGQHPGEFSVSFTTILNT